jgi:hypothetical protein
MDIERSEELAQQAGHLAEGTMSELLYNVSPDWWDLNPDADPPLHPGVTNDHVAAMHEIEGWLGLALADWSTGSSLAAVPLTEGLARARRWLGDDNTDFADAPPSLQRRAEELRALIDQALLALDLDPEGPVVKAAAAAPIED